MKLHMEKMKPSVKKKLHTEKMSEYVNACHQYELEHERKKAVVQDGKETIAH